MEVIQQDTHLTHVVMGARPEEAIQATMEVTPHLFQMFSSGLYSNQRLAVVREVMCNGWDGHIAIGNKQPIEIHFDPISGVLSFKDHGPGLSFDDMKKYYITYNSSSKRDSVNQTGGFGIGCKAPFAYVDSFGVDAYHGGIKSVYQLTKRGEDGSYIPTMQRVVSVPTERTGITVNIQLKPNEWSTFRDLIQSVAFKGEIPTLLSEGEQEAKLLPMLKMNHKMGFVVVNNADLDRICVRVGNVVYPVKRKAASDTAFIDIFDKLFKAFNGHGYSIVMMAPGGSISMTPNREELSMVAATVNNLTLLMKEALSQLTTPLNPVAVTNYINRASRMVAKEYIREVGNSTVYPSLDRFTNLFRYFSELQVCYSTREDRQWINAFRNLDYVMITNLIFNHIRKTHPDHSGELRRLLNALDKRAVNFWAKELDKSLMNQIKNVPKAQILFVRAGATKMQASFQYLVNELKPHKFRFRPNTAGERDANYVLSLANIVIAEPYVTSKQSKISDGLYEVKLNDRCGRIVIHMPRTAKWDERVEAVKKIFPDAVEAHYDEPIKEAKTYVAKANGNTLAVVKKHGYAQLKDCMVSYGLFLEKYKLLAKVNRPEVEHKQRVLAPDCVIDLTDNDPVNNEEDRKFISIFMHIMEEAGCTIGVVTSKIQAEHSKSQGIPDFYDYLESTFIARDLEPVLKYLGYQNSADGPVLSYLPKSYVWKNIFHGSNEVPHQATKDLLEFSVPRGTYSFSYGIRHALEKVRFTYKQHLEDGAEIIDDMLVEKHKQLIEQRSMPQSTAIWLFENFLTKKELK